MQWLVDHAKNVNIKRSDVSSFANSTVIARTMTTDEGLTTVEAVEKFMMAGTGRDSPATFLAWEDALGNDANNAQFHRFNNNEAFSYSWSHLRGCTGFFIVSKRGVYVAHYWETIGFNQHKIPNPDDPTAEPTTRYKTQGIAFYNTITRGLRSGINRGGVAEQDSLRGHAQEIDDDSIHAFLMIPQTGNSDVGIGPEDPYRKYWEKMKKEVGMILPRLNNPDRWHEYKYAPAQDKEWVGAFDPLEHSARGRLLFKYDPDHHGKKKTFLMAETTRLEEGCMEWE
ncbi:hypothetical protein CSOJ01_11990 [Colletotrichum sojae]|uniref:Uncharacterized protein n=1 Tax=Colletotrichum sojae TaxID=2175907 RepID=A0A8H6IWU5_9PEZI|nr:hypothetical protein CSOJ01_11990 [Colletotrichum sojae]